MAEMLTDYFHHDARYEIESVEYCDNALAVLQRRRFDLVLVLSLHVPWTMRPTSYSATWHIDFANAILFLKHLRALHSPPLVILISGSLFVEAMEEALATVDQFGKGDKYFGICTLMATMPGLPMFGHGQVEGFTERYGMEYRRAYYDAAPDAELVARHERQIVPLLHRRELFAQSHDFRLYDFFTDDGWVNEDVFAYSNRHRCERALVIYHNRYARAEDVRALERHIAAAMDAAAVTGYRLP
jgi:hypothetical protein